MKVFYITLKGGMREVARFMTDYLAAYDYSEFEVKHDFSGYPVIIFEAHFEQEEIETEILNIHDILHFEYITYGLCNQEELELKAYYNKTSLLAHKVNCIKEEYNTMCGSNKHCADCKYHGFGDCKFAFALDKVVNENE